MTDNTRHGQFFGSIDAAGRLTIPSELGRAISERYGNQFYITSMDGKSAQVYPLDVWERTKQRLTSLSIFNPLREKFLNLVQYYGQIVEMDAEGTLLIPARLHQSVQFRGDVLVLDNGTYLEVRNREEPSRTNPSSDFRVSPFSRKKDSPR